ncbi:MAG TPA: class I SAM-dependent methyltransferase [Myxococcales bacterium LLY-WYZ-16_1]|nr:class I SAM-dependent methyltransferase [Myxococcales bacterium LLY-WYZ-16_1]
MESRDHYGDGVWYDAEYVHMGSDVPALVAWAGSRQVLELACGTGRLTLPLARAGATIWGVDLSKPMLAQARAKRRNLPEPVRSRIHLVHGDMRTVDLGRRFDRVLVGLNGLMHMLEDPDLEAALVRIRTHLEPDGRALLDLFTPQPVDHPRGARVDPQPLIDPRTGDRWEVTERRTWDPRRQVQRIDFFYRPSKAETAVRTSRVEVRAMYPREMDAWLRWTGFRVVGDWDGLDRSRRFAGTGGRRVLELSPSRT